MSRERTEQHLFVFPFLLLVLIGIINLYSALHLWGSGEHLRLFWMQLLWIGVGTVGGWLLAIYDYRRLYRWSGFWHVIAVALLGLVLLVGRDVAGHRSWFTVGGFGIQPSEFVKLTTVFVLSRFFADTIRPEGFRLMDLRLPMIVSGVPAALILLQGDLGTTLFLLLLVASMVFLARLRMATICLLVATGVILGGIAYNTVLTPSQKGRITSFAHPEDDPRGRGYHLIQSKIAVGSGGIFGRGYLKGRVNKLRYLPEKHTDFVFPVLAEEWGFVGSTLTMLLYLHLIVAGFSIAKNARDRFGSFLAAGITFWLFWQVAINIGGVLGMMPLTGVTLPFLSYGGSSMLVAFAAMGLLLSVHRRRFLF